MTTFGTNFIFFVTKILTFVDEIFRWKTPSVTKFYFIKENFGRRNKIFVTKLLATGLGRRTRHERIFVGECFCRRNLDFQWQNILSLKVNFLVVSFARRYVVLQTFKDILIFKYTKKDYWETFCKGISICSNK